MKILGVKNGESQLSEKGRKEEGEILCSAKQSGKYYMHHLL